jgi:hypothetical protein
MTRRPSTVSDNDNSMYASGHSDLLLNANDVLFCITIPKHKLQEVYFHKEEWIGLAYFKKAFFVIGNEW